MGAVPKSVPNSVAFSAGNSVPVNTRPQLGPHKPMTGNSIVPEVPVTEIEGETPNQPQFSALGGHASVSTQDNAAPTVPGMNGALFRQGPIDAHYQDEYQPKGNPYKTVGRPGTLGWWTRVQSFVNGIATSQDTDNTGMKVRHAQQRTSIMNNALPPTGLNGAFFSDPHPQPQAVAYNRVQPTIGTDAYGSGRATSMGGVQSGRVLNTDTFGAGQTAGGVGGNQYTPTPGPPETTSTAGNSSGNPMPVWG